MSRIRSRSLQQKCVEIQRDVVGSSVRFYEDECMYEFHSDVKSSRALLSANKRTDWPNNPCQHHKIRQRAVRQEYMVQGFWGPTMIETDYWNRPARTVHSILNNCALLYTQEVLNEFKSLAYNKFATVFERFSLINPLIELASVGSLAHGIGKKALSRAELMRATSEVNYLEWEFGVKPMIQDAVNFAERLNTTKASIDAKLEAMSQPIRFRKTTKIPFNPEGSQQVHFYDRSRFEGSGTLTVRVNGVITITPPRLPEFDQRWYIWLDQVGLHADLATVWEAIPFSWFADWFLPIGDSLTALSGNWYSPILDFQGSYSYKWQWNGLVLNDNEPGSRNYNVSLYKKPQIEVLNAKGYSRQPYAYSRGSRSLEPWEPKIPELDARKQRILGSLPMADLPKGLKHKIRSKVRRKLAKMRSRRPILKKKR